ncbi:ATP-binding protein [Iodobacter ciconiae]|uniref:histidine kinase n=1 Tax=Iodobacter ciconiae TaxID=2496266 RepID=A0A3S8ZNX4_9NEIS|nr:transporter substrate-binding domain-containing protein [Iodobacter ciconiae]AZN35175.1 transporter substrate-binding domain-containing protein [Iodobacter ciconiae]
MLKKMTLIKIISLFILYSFLNQCIAKSQTLAKPETQLLTIYSTENNNTSETILKVGMVLDEYIPFYIKDANNNIQGITADYLSIIGSYINKRFLVKVFDTKKNALLALKNKEIDLVAGNLDNKISGIENTVHYFQNNFVEVKRKGEPDKKLPIITLGSNDTLKEEINKKYKNKEIISFKNSLLALQSVSFIHADLYIGNSIETNFLLNQISLNNLEISNFSSINDNPFVFFINKKNSRLLSDLNKAINLIPISSQIGIQQRWQGGPVHYNIVKKITLTPEEKIWIKNNKNIKYSAYSDFYPFLFKTNPTSKPTGIAVDILDKIERLTGLKFIEVNQSGIHNSLSFSGDTTDIIPIMAMSEERKKEMFFSPPYIQSLWGIITRSDNKNIRSVNDLSGKKVAFIKNSIAKETILDPVLRKNIEFIEAANLLSTFNLLEQEKVDAIINNLRSSYAIISAKKIEKFRVIGATNPTPLNISIATNIKKPLLAQIINKAVLSISQEELNDIRSNWANNKSATVYTGLNQYHYSNYRAIFLLLISAAIILLIYIFIRSYKSHKYSQMLKEQLNTLSRLIDQLPFALFINLPSQKIEVSNQPYNDFINNAIEKTTLYARLTLLMKTASKSKNTVYEEIRVQIDKNKHDLILWSKPFLSTTLDQQAVLGGWFDISQQKESERELLKTKNEAETANRAKSTFLAIISHEIRTPMNAILGLIELELKKANNRNLAAIFQSANSLLNLLDGILDQAKIEAGKLSIAPHPCNLYRLLDGIDAVYRPIIKENGLKLMIHIDPGLPDLVLLDEKRLAQVIGNLIGNSIKFTKTGYISIKLNWQVSQQSVLLIEVTDTGSGISHEAQAKIFEAYAQDDLSSKTGTGLGLWICANLIKQMGGEISLQSKPDAGTTVLLQIPSQIIENTTTDKKQNTLTKIDPALELLVVDDHPANRLLLEQQLYFLGLSKVYCLSTASEALELVKTHHFDAIISDCFMPEMDGFTFSKHVREQLGSEIFIIGYTADARESTAIRAQEAGMNHCLIKPVNINQLAEVLSNVQAQDANNQFDDTRYNTIENTITQFSFNNKEVLEQFIKIMQTTNIKDLEDLKNAIDIQNHPLISELAHRLKGAARIIQDKETLFICELLEDAAHSDDITYCLEIYADLKQSILEYNGILDQIILTK